jgi:ferredoxin
MKGSFRLLVDPIACTGHGICAELLPEVVRLDDWGFPIIDDVAITLGLIDDAKRAVTSCPTLALKLERARLAAASSQR